MPCIKISLKANYAIPIKGMSKAILTKNEEPPQHANAQAHSFSFASYLEVHVSHDIPNQFHLSEFHERYPVSTFENSF